MTIARQFKFQISKIFEANQGLSHAITLSAMMVSKLINNSKSCYYFFIFFIIKSFPILFYIVSIFVFTNIDLFSIKIYIRILFRQKKNFHL